MKNNYLIRGLIIASSLSLLSACQHFNNSYSKNIPHQSPSEQGKVLIGNGQAITPAMSEAEEEETEGLAQHDKKFASTKNEKSDFDDVFRNLDKNGSQAEVRKELLMSLSKPGENIYKDAIDKKLKGRSPNAKTGIEEMAEYRRNITMPLGTNKMLYKNGFLETAYEKALQSPFLAKAKAANYKTGKPNSYSLANVTWTERGPNNVPGRGRAIVVSPTNPDKWYDGTAGGGVWITNDAGTSWANTTDYAVPNLATSTIAISPANANIVYAGTGEPFGNLDNITGSGLVKSTDGGATWSYLSNTSAFGSVGRVLVDPADANKVLVGTSSGVYRSTNGGTTWAKTSSAGNVQDLKSNADFSAIYGGVNSVGVIKSTDGGATWTTAFSAPTSVNRIEIAVSPADNNRIYLSTQLNTGNLTGMYYSKNAGTTWTALAYASGDSSAVLSSQGWYDNVITAHPTNVNVAYVGGVYLAKITVNATANTYTVKSLASGYTAGTLNTYVHPDQHGLVCQVNPNNASQFRLLLNNDGGVWYTDYKTNPGETEGDFKAKAVGLNATQFYGADKKKGADAYIAGAQDNGCNATITAPSSATSSYLPMLGGDGFEVLWNYKDTNKLIYGSQYNNFARSVTGVQNTTYINASNADQGSAKSPFYSKLANANNNPDVVFTVSSTGVWRSPDFGASWSVTAFNTTDNGNWTYASQSPATVKVSVANPNVVWAGAVASNSPTSSYKINVSKDNGATFAKTTGGLPINGAYYISGLSASSVNAARAYVLFSVAGMAKIAKTSDYGATWTDITGFSTSTNTGFPDVPVHSLLEMPFDTNVLWAGTDVGVFETTDGGASWYLITGLPPVSVWGMKIVDDQVVLATHGRGVWTATIPELSTYVLPDFVGPPNIKSTSQAGIHDMHGKAVFNYTSTSVTALKVYVDNVYDSTISGTVANTDYTFTSTNALSEGTHTISVVGVYGPNESLKETKSVEIISFNAGAANINLPTFTASDVYVGGGKFVVDKVGGKFTYNVLNNSDHPYLVNTTYQTYLRTPIVVGANSSETLTHAAFTEGDYDFAVVEASTDLVNWVPVGSYDEKSYSDWTNINTSSQVLASGSQFKTSVLDFPSKFTAGDEVAVRLRLTTDLYVNRYGWLIKSIIPSTTLGTSDIAKGNSIIIAPNPAGESTTLYLPSDLKGKIQVGIYDASGKLVKSISETATSKININVNNFQKGVYLVLVKTESGNKALKLMKK